MISALVASEHPLLRVGIKEALREQGDFAVPVEAQDLPNLLTLVDQRGWDVLILDIVMSGRGGLDALDEVRRRRPHLPALILLFSEERFGVQAIQAGANGCLDIKCTPNELVRAVRRLVAGKRYITTTLADALANDVDSSKSRPPEARLSDREFSVMRKIALGKTISEIAGEMSLSPKTITTHRARALEKLGMRSNADFIRFAAKAGLVD